MQLSRKPLGGMRQRYPGEFRRERHVVDAIRRAGLSYGFEEFDAPLIEPLDLFLAKSGSELAVEQSYNFEDRSSRKVILRPELTPSLARMVAAAGELVWPLRWMSFPVCFRYERPQRGRDREFLQFNCDILGCGELTAELEMFLVLRRIMDNLGVPAERYRIAWSSRRFASGCLELAGLEGGEELSSAFHLIDRKPKLDPGDWEAMLAERFPDPARAAAVREFSGIGSLRDEWVTRLAGDREFLGEMVRFSAMLEEAGVESAQFDPGIVRGLDYYTGIVFELVDTGTGNRRAICGGGRYDDLVGLFGGRSVTGVGFGLGILTMTLFLETYGLIPEGIEDHRPALVFMTVYGPGERQASLDAAEALRRVGIPVEMYLGDRDLSKQFRLAGKLGIPWVAVIGPDEIGESKVTLKDMTSGDQRTVTLESIPGLLSQGGA
jgi:histidyl-tRNA synthetase